MLLAHLSILSSIRCTGWWLSKRLGWPWWPSPECWPTATKWIPKVAHGPGLTATRSLNSVLQLTVLCSLIMLEFKSAVEALLLNKGLRPYTNWCTLASIVGNMWIAYLDRRANYIWYSHTFLLPCLKFSNSASRADLVSIGKIWSMKASANSLHLAEGLPYSRESSHISNTGTGSWGWRWNRNIKWRIHCILVKYRNWCTLCRNSTTRRCSNRGNILTPQVLMIESTSTPGITSAPWPVIAFFLDAIYWKLEQCTS